MAKSEQQRQKKLAKKRSKERQRKRTLAAEKQKLASLAGMMSSAHGGSIEYCYLGRSPEEAESGMVTVVLARSGPRG